MVNATEPIRASTLFSIKNCTHASGGVCITGTYHDNAVLIYHDTNVPYLPGGGLAYQATIASGDYQTYYYAGLAYQESLSGMNNVPGIWSIATTPGVTPVSPIINTTSLPSTTVGTTYTANVVSTVPAGDSATVTVTGLPSGLSFNAATNTISGSATVIGSSNISITVTDATTKLSTSNSLVLTVNDIPIIFAPANFADATTNTAYTAPFNAATGGYGSFTYTATGLPIGVNITSNIVSGAPSISGTPTVAGKYNITLTATDSVGVSTSTVVTLNVINPVVVVPTACSGTNAVITAYVTTNPGFITVNGGLNLLDHLWTNNLNAGNTTFNGGLVNWYSTGAIVSWTGTSNPSGCILDHLTVSPRVAISTNTLPTGSVVGTAYTAAVNVTAGVAPYKTTVSGLPAGLSFDGINIVGTPTVAGTFTVLVSTTDSLGVAASASLTLTVSAPPPPVLATPSITLPATGTVGVLYSGSATVTGGVAPFTWTASGLPTGVSISTAGVISGIPTIAATFGTPTITVTDTAKQTVSVTGNNIIISAAPPTATCTAPAGSISYGGVQANVTAVNGTSVTIGTTVVTVPACATISWQGSWSGLTKAIRVGYNVQVSKGYTLNGVITATSLSVDNGL
jgi:hypothetical protein